MLHSLLNSRLKAINSSFVEVLKKIFRACLIHSTVYWVCCVLPLVEIIGTRVKVYFVPKLYLNIYILIDYWENKHIRLGKMYLFGFGQVSSMETPYCT